MRYRLSLTAAFAFAALATAPAAAVVIDFQNLDESVSRQIFYPEVSFTNGSTGGGFINISRNFSTGNVNICALGIGMPGCTGALFATFTNPVQNLAFDISGVNNTTDIVTFFLAFADGQEATINRTGFAVGSVANAVSLTGNRNSVRRLRITSNDTNGVSLDNLSFDVAVAAIPEPATWAMMIGGFGLVGGALRRRPARPAIA